MGKKGIFVYMKNRLTTFRLAALLALLAWAGGLDCVYGDDVAPLQPVALTYTGTHALHENDPNLTGSGVKIAAICRSLTYLGNQPQNDYLLNTGHNCFLDSDVSFVHSGGSGISGHSTAIGAILIGSDPNGYHSDVGTFRYRGASPAAQVDVYEFWRFVSTYVFGARALDADILTMSVGTIFQDWWTRGIERIAEESGIVVVAGIGNGSDVFDSVLYPAAGSNVIGVGVVDSVRSSRLSLALSDFSLPRPEHSSCGPTADMRCKPDLVAPGNCLIPDANNLTGYAVTGDWSSFATPVVAGTVSLLLQKAKSDPSLYLAAPGEGGNCVIKAILMNSATKLPYWHKGMAYEDDDFDMCLDYQQGAGLLDAERAFAQLVAGRSEPGIVPVRGWDNNLIAPNPDTENVYAIDIAEPKGKMFTATVTWNRHYDGEYPFTALTESDSDLRLELWAMDPDNPERSYLIDYSDSINDNVEHIFCVADPNYYHYELVVTHDGLPDRQDHAGERYALAWNVEPATDSGKDDIRWYDFNNDGSVNQSDFTILLGRFGTSPETETGYVTGDINMDGTIDIKDMTLLLVRMESANN